MKRDHTAERSGGLLPDPRLRSPIGVPVPEENDEQGTIRISENVIAAVVRRYTMDIEGVVRFASASIVGGLAEMIGRKSHESSVVVDMNGDGVSITVNLILAFGVRIPDVACTVQEVVRVKVEELTGKHVLRVNVVVQDLDEPTPRNSGEPRNR